MAVQKSKKSRARRNMRRSHDALKPNHLSVDQDSGELHLRHHVGPDGTYRGKQIIAMPALDDEEENKTE